MGQPHAGPTALGKASVKCAQHFALQSLRAAVAPTATHRWGLVPMLALEGGRRRSQASATDDRCGEDCGLCRRAPNGSHDPIALIVGPAAGIRWLAACNHATFAADRCRYAALGSLQSCESSARGPTWHEHRERLKSSVCRCSCVQKARLRGIGRLASCVSACPRTDGEVLA